MRTLLFALLCVLAAVGAAQAEEVNAIALVYGSNKTATTLARPTVVVRGARTEELARETALAICETTSKNKCEVVKVLTSGCAFYTTGLHSEKTRTGSWRVVSKTSKVVGNVRHTTTQLRAPGESHKRSGAFFDSTARAANDRCLGAGFTARECEKPVGVCITPRTEAEAQPGR